MSNKSYELFRLDSKGAVRLDLHPQYWVVRCDQPGQTHDRAATGLQLHESGTKSDLVRRLVENGVPVGMRGAIYLAALPETFD